MANPNTAALEYSFVSVCFFSLWTSLLVASIQAATPNAAASAASAAANIQTSSTPPPISIPRACVAPHDHYPFCNATLSLSERLDDLIGRLTLEEKPYLLTARQSPKGNISRLGIPEYDWGANCIHGVQSRCAPLEPDGTNGKCPTSFPNPNTLGATFNKTVWKRMGQVIGLELRALYLQNVGEYHSSNLPHIGLDCWSPNVGIQRDPRWGRNMETPSEDPHVCGMFGTQYTLGLQNNSDMEDRFLQAVATLKHFDANSLEGPYWTEDGKWSRTHGTISRHSVNAKISLYDLASSYLPAFRMSVQEGGAAGVMCSYNRVNGVPACASEYLLKQVLRRDWKFRGYVTSDSGSINDFIEYHNYTKDWNETVAMAIQAGCDVESANWSHPWETGGRYIEHLADAVRMGLVREEGAVDQALRNALGIRFRLGLFDPIEDQPFWKIPPDVVQAEHHVALANDATAQGFVLLKNDNSILPLGASSGQKVAVIGPHVNDRNVMVGNYLGEICRDDRSNGCVTSFYEGFYNITTAQAHGGTVTRAMGCHVFGNDTSGFEEAIQVASESDVVVFLGGLNLTLENEAGDRPDIHLPSIQVDLIYELAQVNPNIVLVLLHGGMVALDNVVGSVSAIVSVGYPGRYAGMALPSALFGLTENAWGKLPVTWYKNNIVNELNMVDFDMTRPPGRTYRYYTGEPLFRFGYGLNPLTDFELMDMTAQVVLYDKVGVPGVSSSCPCKNIKISVTVVNVGNRAGDEVLLATFTPRDIPKSEPASKLLGQLFGFERIHIAPGESKVVSFDVTKTTLQLFDDVGMSTVFASRYNLQISNGVESVQILVSVKENGDIVVIKDDAEEDEAAALVSSH